VDPPYTSIDLPISPQISPDLPRSPYASLYLPMHLPISPEIFEWTLECSPNIAEWDEASETVVEGWRAYSVWHRGAAYVSGRKVSSKRLRYISPTSRLHLPYISPVSRR